MNVTILMSDTGGGHRSVATAIRCALLRKNSKANVAIVDGLLEFGNYPLNRLSSWYPVIVKNSPRLWGFGYAITDGKWQTIVASRVIRYFFQNTLCEIISSYESDIIISTHPMLISSILDNVDTNRLPFISVVTDLVSAHSWWFDRRASLTIVPTREAKIKALDCGLASEMVHVDGLPVSDEFCNPTDQRSVQIELGWNPNKFTVLLMGGADGVGLLGHLTKILKSNTNNMQFAVVCGRNKQLMSELGSVSDIHLYGFVDNISKLMQAADVVVTKAGPSTIMEVLHCGRELILFGYVPGQEEGNVKFVLQNELGYYATNHEEILNKLNELQHNKDVITERKDVFLGELLTKHSADTIAIKAMSFLSNRE